MTSANVTVVCRTCKQPLDLQRSVLDADNWRVHPECVKSVTITRKAP